MMKVEQGFIGRNLNKKYIGHCDKCGVLVWNPPSSSPMTISQITLCTADIIGQEVGDVLYYGFWHDCADEGMTAIPAYSLTG